MRLIDVLSEHSCCQTVFGVIGPFHHLLQRLELQDLHHWAKNLQQKIEKKQRSVNRSDKIQECSCVLIGSETVEIQHQPNNRYFCNELVFRKEVVHHHPPTQSGLKSCDPPPGVLTSVCSGWKVFTHHSGNVHPPILRVTVSTLSYLLPGNGHVVLHISKHSGLDEVSPVCSYSSSTHQLGSLPLPRADVAQDLVELLQVHLDVKTEEMRSGSTITRLQPRPSVT